MMKSKITKILVLLLIIGLIIMKVFSVGVSASTIDAILSGGNEIEPDENTVNDPAGNNVLNDPLNDALANTNTNTNTNTNLTNLNTNNNTSLPKTGTNENIIIGLMVICTAAGIYAFKKVKEYNM